MGAIERSVDTSPWTRPILFEGSFGGLLQSRRDVMLYSFDNNSWHVDIRLWRCEAGERRLANVLRVA